MNALSWVGLVESGLEDAAVAFLLGPTPLKAKALGKSKMHIAIEAIRTRLTLLLQEGLGRC